MKMYIEQMFYLCTEYLQINCHYYKLYILKSKVQLRVIVAKIYIIYTIANYLNLHYLTFNIIINMFVQLEKYIYQISIY